MNLSVVSANVSLVCTWAAENNRQIMKSYQKVFFTYSRADA